MFSHAVLGSNDLTVSKRFYDAILGTLGVPEGVIDALGRLVYQHAGGRLVITLPVNGEPATSANGSTLGFLADSPEQADAWHAAGLVYGGVTCEDPPGVRNVPYGKIYLAYLRDPAGNKICARYAISST